MSIKERACIKLLSVILYSHVFFCYIMPHIYSSSPVPVFSCVCRMKCVSLARMPSLCMDSILPVVPHHYLRCVCHIVIITSSKHHPFQHLTSNHTLSSPSSPIRSPLLYSFPSVNIPLQKPRITPNPPLKLPPPLLKGLQRHDLHSPSYIPTKTRQEIKRVFYYPLR